MTIVLEQHGEISVGDIDVVSIDYTDWLDEDEVLDTIDSILEIDTSDLTISGEQINSVDPVVILNREVEIDKAVQFFIQGQVLKVLYKIDVTVTSDGGRTCTRQVRIRCR